MKQTEAVVTATLQVVNQQKGNPPACLWYNKRGNLSGLCLPGSPIYCLLHLWVLEVTTFVGECHILYWTDCFFFWLKSNQHNKKSNTV